MSYGDFTNHQPAIGIPKKKYAGGFVHFKNLYRQPKVLLKYAASPKLAAQSTSPAKIS
jgi:hypothetical protein